MSYKDLLNRKATFEKNLELAKERGDTTKARKYQAYINEINVKLEKYEVEVPKEAFEEQKEAITELNKEVSAMKQVEEVKQKKIAELEEQIDKMRHPEKYEPKPEPKEHDGELQCPNCHRWIPEEEMPDHQASCIKTQAT